MSLRRTTRMLLRRKTPKGGAWSRENRTLLAAKLRKARAAKKPLWVRHGRFGALNEDWRQLSSSRHNKK